jgi:hypothetical protein
MTLPTASQPTANRLSTPFQLPSHTPPIPPIGLEHPLVGSRGVQPGSERLPIPGKLLVQYGGTGNAKVATSASREGIPIFVCSTQRLSVTRGRTQASAVRAHHPAKIRGKGDASNMRSPRRRGARPGVGSRCGAAIMRQSIGSSPYDCKAIVGVLRAGPTLGPTWRVRSPRAFFAGGLQRGGGVQNDLRRARS